MAKHKNPFNATMFTATRFHTTEEKAKFGNELLAFIEADFAEAKFTKKFYECLSNTFGFIAHYNRDGFWGTYFTTTAGKIRFLKQLVEFPSMLSGSPEHTFSDVERAVRVALLADGTLARYELQHRTEVEQAERRILASLKAKYEPEGGPAVTGERIPPLADFISPAAQVPQEHLAIQGTLF